jgi:hypothetical protein
MSEYSAIPSMGTSLVRMRSMSVCIWSSSSRFVSVVLVELADNGVELTHELGQRLHDRRFEQVLLGTEMLEYQRFVDTCFVRDELGGSHRTLADEHLLGNLYQLRAPVLGAHSPLLGAGVGVGGHRAFLPGVPERLARRA